MVKSVDMCEAAEPRYIAYSTEVNEDRAILCRSDGLKPVQRRVLWAMFKMGVHGGTNAKLVKAAKVIGSVLGDYHPHGDTSVYDAMVTIARKVPIPMIFGSGNWGTFLGDRAGAYRYTECRLSQYSDIVFFDSFYNPVVSTVLNYNSDPDFREPVVLNALLPNALINPVGGIGSGVAVDMPSYTCKSVVKLLLLAFKQEKCTIKMCVDNLEFTNALKGLPIIASSDKVEFFKTGKGCVQFDTNYNVDVKKRTATLHSNFAEVKFSTAIEKTKLDARVKTCTDIPNKKEKTFSIYMELRPNVKSEDVKKTFKDIVEKHFRNNENYEITVTNRYSDDGEVAKKDLRATTTPIMVNDWIKYRIDLEIRACNWHIEKVQKEIDYRNLLIKAVDKLEVIISALRKRFSKDQLRSYVAKHMHLTTDQAEVIINLKIFQLRKLEKDTLLAEIKERQGTIAGYKKRIKNPAEFICEQLLDIEKKLDAVLQKSSLPKKHKSS